MEIRCRCARTFQVTALIDGCRRLQRPNFPSKLGHIPPGSLWKQSQPTGRQHSAVPASQGLRSTAFFFFFFLKPLGNFSASGRADVPLPSEKEGGSQLFTRNPPGVCEGGGGGGGGRSWPAAFMPVEQAGEELGPLERTADVRVAARLKASGLKCMCATDVRGDSLGSGFFPSCASVL